MSSAEAPSAPIPTPRHPRRASARPGPRAPRTSPEGANSADPSRGSRRSAPARAPKPAPYRHRCTLSALRLGPPWSARGGTPAARRRAPQAMGASDTTWHHPPRVAPRTAGAGAGEGKGVGRARPGAWAAAAAWLGLRAALRARPLALGATHRGRARGWGRRTPPSASPGARSAPGGGGRQRGVRASEIWVGGRARAARPRGAAARHGRRGAHLRDARLGGDGGALHRRERHGEQAQRGTARSSTEGHRLD